MNILGLNYIFHDSAACLLKDGEIAFAVEEERLSREKHTQAFPRLATRQALEQTGTDPSEIDCVAVSVSPGKSDDQKLCYASSLGWARGPFIEYEFDRLRTRNLAFWEWYHEVWPECDEHHPKVYFVDHHLAHAAGTYFVSPWNRAALLSIDGWGEWSTTWAGHAVGSQVTELGQSHFPHSLGVFYSVATQFCGFMPNYDEGKTMGLAPCGDANRFFDVVDSMVSVNDDLSVWLDLSWFDFPKLSGQLFNRRFLEEFGPSRKWGCVIEQHHKDVAAAFQAVLQKNILNLAKGLRKRTGEKHLVYGGGVALNSVANGLIIKERIFDDVFIMPGAGDNGTCIGAAAYVHTAMEKREERVLHSTPYLGRRYSDSEITKALEVAKISCDPSTDIYGAVARELVQGRIVGWFQGRMEFGPRALGARSILADPTNPDIKRKINAEVKHREAFRPFAPSVVCEQSQKYFDIDVDVPYMLKVAPMRKEMRDVIPGVVHVDGTARLQTVDRRIAPEYHALISRFGALSGHPIVLNTSFNTMGEPIVESPRDALRCFFSTGIDVLALGPYLIDKRRYSSLDPNTIIAGPKESTNLPLVSSE